MSEEKNMNLDQTEETLDSEVSKDKEEMEQEKIATGEEKEQKPLKKRILGGVAEILLYVAIAFICIFIIPRYVVQRTQVSGESMELTLMSGDNILVEKMSYRFHEPERFDVIVFYHFLDKDNPDTSDKNAYEYYIKRIIGLPGETVQIIGETIYINGEPLEENYGKDPIVLQGVAEDPIVLGEDEYFVLGDNREVSKDSRDEEVGNIKKEYIIGKAWVRVYPFNQMKFLALGQYGMK